MIHTQQQAADYLSVSLHTLRRLVNEGRLPALRCGRLWRFRQTDLDALFETPKQSKRQKSAARATRNASGKPRIVVIDPAENPRDVARRLIAEREHTRNTRKTQR